MAFLVRAPAYRTGIPGSRPAPTSCGSVDPGGYTRVKLHVWCERTFSQIAEYCIAFITLLAIATLWSPLSCHSLALCVLITAPCSWINPLPCHSDSVCTSLGLLLVYLDYLSALPCWILFADHRPTLVLGILSVLLIHVCLLLTEPCLFLTTSWNKALHMDPHVSRLVRPVTEYSASQGSSGFSKEPWPGMDPFD